MNLLHLSRLITLTFGLVFLTGPWLMAASSPDAAERTPAFWEREMMRIFIARSNTLYRQQPLTREQVREIADAGFNVFGDRWAWYDADRLARKIQLCEQEGLYYAPWIRGTLEHTEDDAKKIVWPSGQVQPLHGPLSPALWELLQRQVLRFAELSKIGPVIGVMLDFENYAENKQDHLYPVSYDVYSLGLYAQHHAITAPPADLSASQARQWVRDQPRSDWSGYEDWVKAEFRRRCRDLREQVDRINPQFLFMVYPGGGQLMTRDIAAAEWGTHAAPYVVLNVNYGRPSPLFSERMALNVLTDHIRTRQADWQQRSDVPNVLMLTGAMPGYRGSDPEYSAKKLAIGAREGQGYWIWYSHNRGQDVHRQWMSWYRRANKEITAGTYALADAPRQTPEIAEPVEINNPDHRQVGILNDMRSGLQNFFANELPGYETHRLAGGTLDYLQQFDLVIMQRASVPTEARPDLHDALRQYVEQGGALILAYDSIANAGSPFPEIVVEASTQPFDVRRRSGDYLIWHSPRKIVTDDPALLAGIDSDSFNAHYGYHQPLVIGPAATIITQNSFGVPVMALGQYGRGYVLVVGDFLARRQPPPGVEGQLLKNAIVLMTAHRR